MAYSRDAIIRDQQETRERQDQSETSVRLERYGDMEDGLSQSNKIAGESQRELETRERARETQRESQRDLERDRDQRESQIGDMELFRQLDDGQTNKQMDLQSYSLSRYRD